MRPSMYKRPDKPKFIPVTRRETGEVKQPPPLPEPVIVDRDTECHVTPPDVADRMVDYLELEGMEKVLEPEAGTGNLVAALLRAGHPAHLIAAYELNVNLIRRFRECCPDVDIEQGSFLEAVDTNVSRILMNPPFRTVKQHVAKAVSILRPEGICVALVPITFNWEGAELLETLPNDTFASAKVNTKIICIRN